MPAIKTTLRRLAMPGIIALAMTTAGFSYADSVRTIKIATAAESKPLSWGAIGVEPQGYEPDVLKAVNAKLPQYKFVMEGPPIWHKKPALLPANMTWSPAVITKRLRVANSS